MEMLWGSGFSRNGVGCQDPMAKLDLLLGSAYLSHSLICFICRSWDVFRGILQVRQVFNYMEPQTPLQQNLSINAVGAPLS